jgi:pSer/pThr/pTyr-binding forkhead associated (FHA) protein
MLTLHIFRNGDRLQSLRFDKKVVTLGRAAPSDVIFHDPTISKTHCVISKKPDGWLLEDCSKNGVILPTGQPVTERTRLEASKRYHLGKSYAIEIDPQDSKHSKEATILVAQKPTQLLKIDEGASQITLGTASLSVTLPDGRVVQKTIEQATVSIGSHDSNDFVIPSESVSLFHSRIDFIAHSYMYSDLGSTNGSKIKGLKIERAPLPPNCEIEMGTLRLHFTLKEEKLTIAPKECTEFVGMVAKSKSMQKIFSTIEIVANTDAPVFVTGETGTGKELVARAVHELSRRFHHPFIALNCAALPKDMIESELFGHEKGAFTGAVSERHGAFEAAHQGTLFLDEIGELSPDLQAKLLRVLESGEVKRLGSNKIIKVSVRIVTATHRNLVEDVVQGRFRQDLL